jgi:hypothetical protein
MGREIKVLSDPEKENRPDGRVENAMRPGDSARTRWLRLIRAAMVVWEVIL